MPISYQEIEAYNRSTNAFLKADEVLLIRKMSAAYCAELNDRNPSKPAPFGQTIRKSNSFVEALKSVAVRA